MRVLHISHSDRQGGAAIAAYRLSAAMNQAGIESRMLVQTKLTDDETVCALGRADRLLFAKIRAALNLLSVRTKNKRLGTFSAFTVGRDISGSRLVREADIIYLHWVCGGFLNLKGVERILRLGKPVYWFLHDMFPITGGCHHSFTCVWYTCKGVVTGGCHYCQFFAPDGAKGRRNTAASRLFRRKLRLFRKYENLSFVAPSAWLAGCAEKSALTAGRRVYHIPNLIDLSVYKPVPKTAARLLFNIPEGRKVIAFGADSALTNPYKGFEYLEEALRICRKKGEEDIVLLIFGSGKRRAVEERLAYPAVFAGVLHDDWAVAMVYNAADVFVIPSLAENFPNTAAEALACGTPAAGFDVGGIPDLITEDTGALCGYRDAERLAEGIRSVLAGEKKLHAREHAAALCGAGAVIGRHKEMWGRQFSNRSDSH